MSQRRASPDLEQRCRVRQIPSSGIYHVVGCGSSEHTQELDGLLKEMVWKLSR